MLAGSDLMRQFLEDHGGQADFSTLKPSTKHDTLHRSKSMLQSKRAPPPPQGELPPQSSSSISSSSHVNASRPHSARYMLLSSALDCAIVGTSSQIVDKLHSVTDGGQANHIPNNINSVSNYNSLDRSAAQSRQHEPAIQQMEAKQQYSSAAGPPPQSSDPYMRNNSSARNSVQRERPKRFTELLNSMVVNDHFDQYGTMSSQCSETSSYYGAVPPHEDSGLGGLTPDEYSPGYSDHDSPMNGAQEPMTPMSPPIPLPIHPNQQQHPQHPQQARYPQQQMSPTHHLPNHASSNRTMSPTPSSQQEDTSYSATARPLSRPLQRRKTLPSIVKRPPTIGESKDAAAPNKEPEPETFVIENGVRKRVKAEVYKTPPSPPPSPRDNSDEKPKQLPSRYKLESSNLRRIANRGSLPDVSSCKDIKITPREEMTKLSEARRDELMRLQDEEERRRQQEIVLRLTDLKVSSNI